MKNGYGNLLSIMLIVAIIIVVAILGFFGYKVYTSNQTDKKAHNVVADFDENVNNNNNPNSSDNSDNSSVNNDENSSLGDILNNLGEGDENSIYQQQGNKGTYYQGYKVIGTISIPSINIEYPILEVNTAATLKIAIVAVYPQEEDREDAVNKPGNLVLWGHNYKNGTFFSDIGKLTTGAKIYIKDTSGTKLEYQVYNVYTTSDSDMTYAARDTKGAREITLSTCDNAGGKRTIVWARET